ncbi:MAG: hypothetical protein JWR35_3924 [Marmoricola sp.]|nr:hypothetical protein [Marmoricola sp.]
MRLAIADPPYLGQGARYEHLHDEAHRWDDPRAHLDLLRQLEATYDGWVLATHGHGLRILWANAPEAARIGVWVKARRRAFPMTRVSWGHEFVIFRQPGGRRGAAYGKAEEPSMRKDVVLTGDTLFAAVPRSGGRILGEKPPAWTHWALALLDYRPEDSVEDLFPGSGAVTDAIATYPHGRCPTCRSVLPSTARRDAVYCRNACRQAAHRKRASVRP